ncbi:DUF3883 domain-containing protein [Mesorhizobium tamadayense]|uniref:DUF3883 domain-containing protein n=1 Tax=Mesorhizobium tamadayense TaxID=425306 RepID=A0A3P3FFF1_9HYPH|nr:DUF3883 domain-containing protein [Mesorhizobium tamadayense]RRH96896.1 DUF3883 domain-containing protein [Mesorhizobium tamadayense]
MTLADARTERLRTSDGTSDQGEAWTPPDFEPSDFAQSIGASFVEQFVLGHDPIDVLRELVQNEFDAGGETMSLVFGRSGLTIKGSGRHIDELGWSRLSVIVGVGRVVGDTSARVAEVAPKERGIGSKNFGLRSLFRFGDRIHVRSNGTMAVMDLPTLGTKRLADPASEGVIGVTIYVPFRDRDAGKLPAFTEEVEASAIEGMAAELFDTLGKLSLAGATRGIRRLELKSSRTGKNLLWFQTALTEKCSINGIDAIRRIGRLERWSNSDPDQKQTESSEEIEYGRSVERPSAMTIPDFSAYYDEPKGKLRVAVSLPIKRRRVQLQQQGYYHYPLKAPGALTGAVVGISAPFELNIDRSEIVATPWNEWLANQAAVLSADLLTKDWLDAFGADAYLALAPSHPPKRAWFMERTASELSTRDCWATEKKGVFSSAEKLVVPSHPLLRGFLGELRDVRSDLSAAQEVLKMAAAAGAKQFTPNSLVRLRCSVEPRGAGLASKAKADEAQFHYPDHAASLRKVALQVSFGKSLDAVSKSLSNNNRTDLANSPSTLAADGTLDGAGVLVIVPDEIWDVCPVPLGRRLHPALFVSRVLRGLAKQFDVNEWACDIAERASAGTADEGEIEALYRHLLAGAEGLNRRTISQIKRSPVLKANGGGWHAADDLVQLPRELMKALGDAVMAPATAVSRNGALLKKLAIRRKLSSKDLVSLAERAATGETDPDACAALIVRYLKLFTPSALSTLGKVAFMRNAAGGLSEPRSLHADTDLNRAILNDETKIVGSVPAALVKATKIHRLPPYSTLIACLNQWRAASVGPKNPAVFYSALVAIMAEEKKSAFNLKSDPVLWLGNAYRAPEDTLVGSMIPRCFDLVFPVVQGEDLQKALVSLGAQRTVGERHWTILFEGIAEKAENGWTPTAPERAALRQCYSKRGNQGLPNGISNDADVFLAQTGTLHSRNDLANGVLLENDFPELARAIAKESAEIVFADLDDGGAAFFGRSGLRRLSEVCGSPFVSTGDEQKRPLWYQPAHEADLLTMLHDPDFAIALQELRWATNRNLSPDRSAREMGSRLAAVSKVQFYAAIEKTFSIGGISATVASSHAAANGEIALLPPRNLFDYRLDVAAVLAEVAGAERLDDIRALAAAILPLLAAQSVADIRSYLASRGLSPRWTKSEAEDQLFEDTRPAVQAEAAVNDLLGQLMSDIASRNPSTGSAPSRPSAPTATAPSQSIAPTLPPIDTVHATVLAVIGAPVAQIGGNGGGYGGGFSYRTPAEMERDRLTGMRGEEIAFDAELRRVTAEGHADAADRVVWTSKTNPGADHDIRSVSSDGRTIYIEVKSTTGDDGRFEWSAAEFALALKYGDDYELWRIYRVDEKNPTIKKFKNPAAMLAQGTLRLQLSGVRAAVEPRI